MSMYDIRVQSRFEAAHHLISYRGSPEPVHGHSWQVEACVCCEELNDEGYGVDFLELKGALDELAASLDHRDLNTVPPFDETSPTSENLARWFWERLSEALDGALVGGRSLAEVTIFEAPGCSVTYRASGA